MSKPGLKDKIDRLGNVLVSGFQVTALFVIGATLVWSAVNAYVKMMQAGHARLDDILLLFIYLELGTIVGIYFKTEKLPVLFLLYVAITALTRFLAIDIKVRIADKEQNAEHERRRPRQAGIARRRRICVPVVRSVRAVCWSQHALE